MVTFIERVCFCPFRLNGGPHGAKNDAKTAVGIFATAPPPLALGDTSSEQKVKKYLLTRKLAIQHHLFEWHAALVARICCGERVDPGAVASPLLAVPVRSTMDQYFPELMAALLSPGDVDEF